MHSAYANFRRGLLCMYFIFGCHLLKAQVSFYLGEKITKFEVQQGFLFPHHADMSHLYSGYQSLEFKSLKTLKGVTHHVGSPVKMGIHAGYYHFNSNYLRNGVSAGLAFGFPLNKFSERFYSNFNFTYGLGYISRPFDVVKNPMNRAIGSHINGYAQLSLELGKKFSDRWSMGVKLGMSHFSNGNAKAPNLGVNLPFASVTLNRSIYFWRENKGLSKLKSDSLYKRWFVSSRVGYKSVDVDDARKLVVFVIEGGHAWNIKQHVWKTSVSVHSDPIYRFEKFQKMEDFSFANGIEGAAAVGYERKFDDWKLCLDLGLYLFAPAKGYKTAYFERLGVSRRLTEHLEAQVKLRANKTIADVVEWGLVYSW